MLLWTPLFLAPLPGILTITVSPLSSDLCEKGRILNCSANQVENLSNPPSIVWIGPDGSEILPGGGGNPMIMPETGELILSDITSTNSGLYTCRAVDNPLESQISYHFEDAVISVNTESK